MHCKLRASKGHGLCCLLAILLMVCTHSAKIAQGALLPPPVDAESGGRDVFSRSSIISSNGKYELSNCDGSQALGKTSGICSLKAVPQGSSSNQRKYVCSNTLSSSGIDIATAAVACRSLGWDAGRPAGLRQDSSVSFGSRGYACRGSEAELASCESVTSSVCSSNNIVQVQCYMKQTPFSIYNADRCGGKSCQVKYTPSFGQAGPICVKTTTTSKINLIAKAACRALGFSDGLGTVESREGNDPYALALSSCSTTAGEPLAGCTLVSGNPISCSGNYGALRVSCSFGAMPSTFQVGFPEGCSPTDELCQLILKLQSGSEWYVSPSGFGIADARVACSQAGFTGSDVDVGTGAETESASVWGFKSVRCTGSESSLQQCVSKGWQYASGRDEGTPVAVRCSKGTSAESNADSSDSINSSDSDSDNSGSTIVFISVGAGVILFCYVVFKKRRAKSCGCFSRREVNETVLNSNPGQLSGSAPPAFAPHAYAHSVSPAPPVQPPPSSSVTCPPPSAPNASDCLSQQYAPPADGAPSAPPTYESC